MASVNFWLTGRVHLCSKDTVKAGCSGLELPGDVAGAMLTHCGLSCAEDSPVLRVGLVRGFSWPVRTSMFNFS